MTQRCRETRASLAVSIAAFAPIIAYCAFITTKPLSHGTNRLGGHVVQIYRFLGVDGTRTKHRRFSPFELSSTFPSFSTPTTFSRCTFPPEHACTLLTVHFRTSKIVGNPWVWRDRCWMSG